MAAGSQNPATAKTPGIIEAEIIMSRTAKKSSFLLVEGDDDIRFFRTRIADKGCELVNCVGKLQALGAVVRLDRRRFQGAVAVVDDDFDLLESISAPSSNIVTTDAHDLECLLLRSRALDSVLAEYGDAARIRMFELHHKQTVREALIERGLVLGQLRWLALRQGWPVDFKPLKAARFLDAAWQLDKASLFAEVVRLGVPLPVAEIQNALDALPSADPWRVCQGHDLIDILVVGLKTVLGQAKNPGRDPVGKMLRQSIDRADFAGTGLYAGLRGWESANAPYRVLGD